MSPGESKRRNDASTIAPCLVPFSGDPTNDGELAQIVAVPFSMYERDCHTKSPLLYVPVLLINERTICLKGKTENKYGALKTIPRYLIKSCCVATSSFGDHLTERQMIRLFWICSPVHLLLGMSRLRPLSWVIMAAGDMMPSAQLPV